jgi:hypothetical protein
MSLNLNISGKDRVKSDHSTMLIKAITVASKKNDMFAWTSTCIRQPL